MEEVETGTRPYACESGNTKVMPHVEFVGLGFDLFGLFLLMLTYNKNNL